MEKYDRGGQATVDDIIRRMRFAFWINKATNTSSEYITLIAFPLQQCFRESDSVLRYTYNARLVVYTDVFTKECRKNCVHYRSV